MKRNFRAQEAKTRRQLALVSWNDLFMNGLILSESSSNYRTVDK